MTYYRILLYSRITAADWGRHTISEVAAGVVSRPAFYQMARESCRADSIFFLPHAKTINSS